MSKNRGEYRGVFKATAILGSVQLFNILIAVVRNKCISILLGPAGMGIMGLLTSATGTITGFTNLGITFSAIKNIASAYEKGDYTTLCITALYLDYGIIGSNYLFVIMSAVEPMDIW